MGHACSILEFSSRKSEKTIEKECMQWQLYNADLYECGPKGPRFKVKFTSKLFSNRDEAYKYLDSTFGHYDQTAVRFKDGRKTLWAVACEVHC